ncbi:MAG: ankyrin repeat domain-containing protein [Alphaproteobacteria bacterium]
MADGKLTGDFNAGKNPVSASEFDRAIFNQDVERLQELIAALKMPKEQKVDFLTTELRKACALVYHGTIDIGIIDALIDAGGKVNQPQGRDASPFGIICQSDDVTVLRHMIKRGADVNADVNIDQFGCAKPLHFACGHSQNPEIVKELLNNRANPNAKGFFGQTPLHMAAAAHPKKSRDGQTADRTPVVDLLLKNGAKIDAVDKWEHTPLLSLIAHSPDAKVAEKLIDEGASLKHVSPTDGSPLHMAAERGLHEIVGLLIRKGAPLLLKNAQGRTPTQHAKEHLEGMRKSAEEAPAPAAKPSDIGPSNSKPGVNFGKVLQSLEEAEKLLGNRGVRNMIKRKFGR